MISKFEFFSFFGSNSLQFPNNIFLENCMVSSTLFLSTTAATANYSYVSSAFSFFTTIFSFYGFSNYNKILLLLALKMVSTSFNLSISKVNSTLVGISSILGSFK